MKGIRFAEGLKVLPILAPVAFTTSEVASAYVHMDVNQWATFLVSFGVMTSDSTDIVTVTVECSSAVDSTTTGVAIAFSYRLSAAVATDTMGAITAATSAGVAVTATDDAKMLVIDVDPAVMEAGSSEYKWLHVVLTPSAGIAAGVASIVAVLEPRYPGNSIPSTT